MTNFSLRCHQVDHMSAKLPTDNLIECPFFFRQTNKVTGQSSFFFYTHTQNGALFAPELVLTAELRSIQSRQI